MDKHSDERSYTCTFDLGDGSQCGKSFTTGTKLRRHVAAHEAKEETKCTEPGCGKLFRKQETLQRHIKQDHLQQAAFSCTHVDFDTYGELSECGKEFITAKQLRGHIEREHSGKRYFCDLCSPPQDLFQEDAIDPFDLASAASDSVRVNFPTYTDLQQHIKVAHAPTCAECGTQCESNRALKAHIAIRALRPRRTPKLQMHLARLRPRVHESRKFESSYADCAQQGAQLCLRRL